MPGTLLFKRHNYIIKWIFFSGFVKITSMLFTMLIWTLIKNSTLKLSDKFSHVKKKSLQGRFSAYRINSILFSIACGILHNPWKALCISLAAPPPILCSVNIELLIKPSKNLLLQSSTILFLLIWLTSFHRLKFISNIIALWSFSLLFPDDQSVPGYFCTSYILEIFFFPFSRRLIIWLFRCLSALLDCELLGGGGRVLLIPVFSVPVTVHGKQ